ncbi:5-formyltetrahydrofolate cyclo-ligase [Pontibaca salina]|uniref:5-formyltetrahydrofolate cyclo-ligase n=1 Tax=Pontibaca salina TaxID=2795731 RepID=A0A934HTT6_9RHOB|nr:5-formyltetrahydrofolate cyclo-ligase [Pontibaca salina]MBI6630098.1 5-formyltetrahydrofolate cyclo-ligase [Pontibaca salina]
MTDLTKDKTKARKDAFARRKTAHAASGKDAAAHLAAVLARYRGMPLSGYLPIRTEIDPLPAMAEAAAHGPVGIPVIPGPDQPLNFARWTPDMPLVDGPFGAAIPAEPEFFEPELVIVPLVAFDAYGGRLGYGGGFYDRTLELLRQRRPTLAIGFAFDQQEAESLPLEPTDQPLDMLVTQSRVLNFNGTGAPQEP